MKKMLPALALAATAALAPVTAAHAGPPPAHVTTVAVNAVYTHCDLVLDSAAVQRGAWLSPPSPVPGRQDLYFKVSSLHN